MDEVWCSLDMANDIAGLQGTLADPFWPAFTDCAASFIANDDNACFGLADVDLMVSTNKVEDMVDMDASGFLGGEDDQLVLQQEPMLSSKRTLSIDSGGSSASFTLDAALAAAATNVISQYPAPAPPVACHPFAGGDHDDTAIMRAMMAVISSSSASPSSSSSASASSPPPFSRDSMQQAAMPQPRGGNGHVMVRSSLATPPEKTASLSTSGGDGRGQQQEEPITASGNSSQLYHMMSERKRREKLNDSFHTLRSLLPPCSKKDKTTVLMNAASYLKTLEAQISELEEKNTKLEKHIPCEDGGRSDAMRARAARQRAKVQISKASSDRQGSELVNLTVMVMVECDIVDLVLRILECLRWMKEISVLSVDADTYSPQVLLKSIASIKLQIMDGDWNEASFHEAMTKAVNDATSSCAPLVLTA